MATLFDVVRILDPLAIGPDTGTVAELGCGTFTIPVATRTRAVVYANDNLPPTLAS